MAAAPRPLAGLAAVALLAGCGGPPAGIDRDLVGDWPPMPEPVQVVPEAGVCLDNPYQENVALVRYARPVDCSDPHQLETIYVGEFDEEDVIDQDESPDPGTARWREAFQECDEADDEYLGADFRHGDLWLGVAVPRDDAWAAGARWFRCDLVEQQSFFQSQLWPDTLRGALSEAASLLPGLVLGCFKVEIGEIADGRQRVSINELVACSEPHEAEFVGVGYLNRRDYPESDGDWRAMHEDCRELVTDYIGGSPVVLDVVRIGTLVLPPVRTDWDNGDRGFRCFLYVDEPVSESLEAVGADAGG